MRVLILLGMLLWAGAAVGQDDAPETLHVSSQFVLLDASVEMKATGAKVEGLTLDDFVLKEDKKPQTLTYLSEDRLPLSVTFLFDATESVRPVLRTLAEGAVAVLGHLKPEDEVAVLTFTTHTNLLQGFTTDRALVLGAIERAAATKENNEPTFIYEDMVQAVRETAKAKTKDSRRVQLWLTDGTANNPLDFFTPFGGKHGPGLKTKEQASEVLGRSGQVVTELIEMSDIAEGEMSAGLYSGERFGSIHAFANGTGGPVMESAGREVAAKMGVLIDAIRQRYTVGYKPARVLAVGTLCRVELKLSDGFFARHPGLRPRDVVVRTRQSYYR